MLRLLSLSVACLTCAALTAQAQSTDYDASFDKLAIQLDEIDGPYAEIGHFEYIVPSEDPATRPVTFLWNGGPGASSIYLHMMAVGPKILETTGDGSFVDATGRVIDNPHSWLEFTDLVFVDPVGTGLSRAVTKEGELTDGSPFWTPETDINALGTFIRTWLSENDRWMSPLIIAGESYGGTRVAELSITLPSEFGVQVDKAVLISPYFGDRMAEVTARYGVLEPALIMPTYAAIAASHGRGTTTIDFADPDTIWTQMADVNDFAMSEYMIGLSRTGSADVDANNMFYKNISEIVGLNARDVAVRMGRIDFDDYAKNFFEEGLVLDIYDGSQINPDPLADKPGSSSLAPTLVTLEPRIARAAFPYFQDVLGMQDLQDYELLNFDVYWDSTNLDIGHASDLAHALAYDEKLEALVVHGVYDMVTPWFRSHYLMTQSILADARPDARTPYAVDGTDARASLRAYEGGHMFYLYENSRAQFFEDVRDFIVD